MTLRLKLLVRVVCRRVENGEDPESVLADYPRLTENEKKAVREALKQN